MFFTQTRKYSSEVNEKNQLGAAVATTTGIHVCPAFVLLKGVRMSVNISLSKTVFYI